MTFIHVFRLFATYSFVRKSLRNRSIDFSIHCSVMSLQSDVCSLRGLWRLISALPVHRLIASSALSSYRPTGRFITSEAIFEISRVTLMTSSLTCASVTCITFYGERIHKLTPVVLRVEFASPRGID